MSSLPLKWSALRWAYREWRIDRQLRTPAGFDAYRQRLVAESEQFSATNLMRQVLHLGGDVMECGVYRGYSLLRMAMTLELENASKTIYGLDSFAGFPDASVQKIDVASGRFLHRVQSKFQHVEHVPDRIRRLCGLFGWDNVELVKGYFEDTLPQLQQRQFCFIYLDCDIYSSYQTCLQLLYDRLVPGGIMAFDEYDDQRWPGATRAIDEFFADRPEQPLFDGEHRWPRYYIRRSAVPSVTSAA